MKNWVMIVALLMGVGLLVSVAPQEVAAQKLLRASAIGTGTTKGEAYTAAARVAQQIAGGFYSKRGEYYAGSEGFYTCTLVIEYRPR